MTSKYEARFTDSGRWSAEEYSHRTMQLRTSFPHHDCGAEAPNVYDRRGCFSCLGCRKEVWVAPECSVPHCRRATGTFVGFCRLHESAMSANERWAIGMAWMAPIWPESYLAWPEYILTAKAVARAVGQRDQSGIRLTLVERTRIS